MHLAETNFIRSFLKMFDTNKIAISIFQVLQNLFAVGDDYIVQLTGDANVSPLSDTANNIFQCVMLLCTLNSMLAILGFSVLVITFLGVLFAPFK